jgi:hypothetical protein
MPTKRPRTTPRSAAPLLKRRTKTLAQAELRHAQNPKRNPDQPIPEIARVYATNIVKRLWPSLHNKVAVTTAPP